MAANSRGASVEFIVKPKEDLYLEGSLRKLPRVTKGEPYPCQMQKAQAFSCLFRHYAKHNGLRKEDLVFYFTDELQPDQTPESVHLMVQDEIFVEHRKPVEIVKEVEIQQHFYSESFGSLLDNPIHSDITFIFPSSNEEVYAHKAILSARSKYFCAMFKKGGMAESIEKTLIIENYEKSTFTKMLEYVYTNNVKNLESCQTSEIEAMLIMSNEYCFESLQHLCEMAASRMLTFDNISRFTILSISYGESTNILKHACKEYLSNNMQQLRRDEQFRKEIEEFPQIGLFLFDAWPEDNNGYNSISSSSSLSALKKRRISSDNVINTSSINGHNNISSNINGSSMNMNTTSNNNNSYNSMMTHTMTTNTTGLPHIATTTIHELSNEISGLN